MKKELEPKQIQRIAIEIIKSFDEYCRDQNLRYYLAGGTLLGAVRHKGFIPWDDDVDIMMPRRYYNAFVNSFSHSRYKVVECFLSDDYNTPFARVYDSHTYLKWDNIAEKDIGVFIDIFPIDGYPANELISKIHVYRLKYLRAKINSAQRTKLSENAKYLFLKKIMRHLWRKKANQYSRKMNKVAMKYDFDSSEYVGVTTTTDHLLKERNKKSLVFGGADLKYPFEELELPVPNGYDIYLRRLYGDYMQLPPESKRVTIHTFKAYEK